MYPTTCDCNNDRTELKVAFISKTAPPPQMRQPRRFWYCTNNYNNRNIPRVFNKNPQVGKWWGWEQNGHFSQNRLHKHRYVQKINKFTHAGSTTVALTDLLDNNHASKDHLNEVLLLLVDFGALDQKIGEVDSWHANVLDTWGSFDDSSYRPDCCQMQVLQLRSTLHECAVNYVFDVTNHFLLYTAALKCISSSDWTEKVQQKSTPSFTVPENFRPFRFARQKVNAPRVAFLTTKLCEYCRKSYYLRQLQCVLFWTPIPFLDGVGTAQNLALSVNTWERRESSHFMLKWKAIVSFTVLSYLWIEFEPLNTKIDFSFDWQQLDNAVLQ